MNELLKKLIGKQKAEGLSDAAFAKKLGISSQFWRFTRTGRRKVGLKLLKRATVAYPDLQADVLFFLRSDVTIGDTVD